MTNRQRYIWAFIFLAALGSTLSGAPKEAPKADLTLKDMNGKKVRLRDLQGKVVVVNFWATWCIPCMHEMPMLVDSEKEYSARGVVFIAASLDDDKSRGKIPAFVSKYQITFPVWVGADAGSLSRLGLGEAVPDTVFIDAEGKVAFRVLGEIRKDEVTDRLEWLTGKQTGTAPEGKVVHLDTGR